MLKRGDKMSRETTCCFTGHRILGKDYDRGKLNDIVLKLHTEKGVDTFICGGALGFDIQAALVVLNLKRSGYNVALHIYAPCNNQSAKWSEADKNVYIELLKVADYVDMVDRPYFDGCMKDRNYKMVDNSRYCIAYYHEDTKRASGTGQTFRYAKKCGLEVVNLGT